MRIYIVDIQLVFGCPWTTWLFAVSPVGVGLAQLELPRHVWEEIRVERMLVDDGLGIASSLYQTHFPFTGLPGHDPEIENQKDCIFFHPRAAIPLRNDIRFFSWAFTVMLLGGGVI